MYVTRGGIHERALVPTKATPLGDRELDFNVFYILNLMKTPLIWFVAHLHIGSPLLPLVGGEWDRLNSVRVETFWSSHHQLTNYVIAYNDFEYDKGLPTNPFRSI